GQFKNKSFHHDAVVRPRATHVPVGIEDQLQPQLQLLLGKLHYSLLNLLGARSPHGNSQPAEVALDLLWAPQISLFRHQRHSELRRQERQRQRQIFAVARQRVEDLQRLTAVTTAERAHQ